ncbi:hypothetical protein KSP39_PZI001090 [Platanthera zijinensis]|uniref:Reverse transcriptase domain-containing protein n=1 Tax=Platanthera zijinensis TaxID=2320716 RepID=A0AAP0C0V0_9ASPA
MKPLLSKLISEEQSAFVPGSLLSDNCILAQEMFHQLHTTKSKAGCMAIKVDMEKSFERMQWSIVRHVLHAFKFPDPWIQLIMDCISSPKFGLLINGSKARWIETTCRLRKGCPLSPYLFILCSQFLSILINRSRHPGIVFKISVVV